MTLVMRATGSDPPASSRAPLWITQAADRVIHTLKGSPRRGCFPRTTRIKRVTTTHYRDHRDAAKPQVVVDFSVIPVVLLVEKISCSRLAAAVELQECNPNRTGIHSAHPVRNPSSTSARERLRCSMCAFHSLVQADKSCARWIQMLHRSPGQYEPWLEEYRIERELAEHARVVPRFTGW